MVTHSGGPGLPGRLLVGLCSDVNRSRQAKCDGNIPCGRCFDFSLPCRIQTRQDEAPIPIDQRAISRADPRQMVWYAGGALDCEIAPGPNGRGPPDEACA